MSESACIQAFKKLAWTSIIISDNGHNKTTTHNEYGPMQKSISDKTSQPGHEGGEIDIVRNSSCGRNPRGSELAPEIHRDLHHEQLSRNFLEGVDPVGNKYLPCPVNKSIILQR